MKSMKLIMENFRKTMKEAQFGDPDFTPGPNPYFDYDKGQPKSDPEADAMAKKKEEMINSAAATVAKEILSSFGGEFGNVYQIMQHPTAKIDARKLRDDSQRALGDEIAKAGGDAFFKITEDDMLAIIDAINMYKDPEHEEPMPSDQQDNPGFAKGEGGNY